MKNKRFSWKNTINSIMGSLSLVLIALIIALGFISPTGNQQARALTKDYIIDTYNISFNSAKTNVKVADSYSFASDGKSYEYVYRADSEAELYSETTASEEYSSDLGDVSLQVNDLELKQYIKRTRESGLGGYIPNNITHFRTVNDELEPIFFDEIDN